MRAQAHGAAIVRAEIVLDRAHRIEHALALWRRERCEDRAHLLLRAFVERGERAAARSGQREHVAPRIVLGGRAREPALGAEALENAAEIALVETERAGKLGGADAAMVRELVHHAHFGQRKRTLEEALVEHADTLRVEAVEASRGFDVSGEHGDAAIGYAARTSSLSRWLTKSTICAKPCRFAAEAAVAIRRAASRTGCRDEAV